MFNISILTPHKKIVTDKPVAEVFVPGASGEMHILPGHAPLMATMKAGILKVRYEGESKLEKMAISWGYAQVNPQGVNILAETAETAEEIDVDRANFSHRKSEKNLSGDLEADAIEKNMAKLERAQIRLEVAGESKHTH